MPETIPVRLRPAAEYSQALAVSVHVGRNQIVQALGVSMVCVVGLSVAPWPLVAGWALAIVAVVGAEDILLRRLARGARASQTSRVLAPALRILATTLYALAAFVLMIWGGGPQRLFAFALMSASMVHVLMRYYRSPPILVASVAPYVAILALGGFGMTREALSQGRLLTALAPPLTILMFAVQIWAARAQLAAVWGELMRASEGAEQRERAAEAANLAKSQFLATMSHELRTPLNGVLGMAQALSGGRLTAIQRERVGIIRRSSESLLAVLNDLLDLSKIEASSLELEMVEFDLERLVQGVAAAYEPAAARKQLRFACEIEPDACGSYLGDSARIRRILYSLTDNAVKFTDRGAVTLRVRRQGPDVAFSVIDTGIGIGREDLARLFESFFQVETTLTRRYSGTGVGLAICRELAALMGGAVEATSEPGEGSAFTLTLPLQHVAGARPATGEPQPGAAPARDLRVLAAEDNPTNQLVLKALLAAAGIEPTIVADGREAVTAWERQEWDIILMDIQMPEMNGVEATQAIRLRERQAGRACTPIVAVTANAMTHQLAQYAAAGLNATVPKPIDAANLLIVMEQVLSCGAAGSDDLMRAASQLA